MLGKGEVSLANRLMEVGETAVVFLVLQIFVAQLEMSTHFWLNFGNVLVVVCNQRTQKRIECSTKFTQKFNRFGQQMIVRQLPPPSHLVWDTCHGGR